jgi:NitT/TauT family transport system ATP-binding protein
MSGATIHIDRVSLAYGTPPRPILEAISLDIVPGEFVCILGQTGCGKSTLLRLLLGAERPNSGRILIDGAEHPHPDRSRGYVPQKYSLFPDRTVLDNLTFGPEVCEFGLLTRLTPAFYRRRRELRHRAIDYLRRIGLREADANKYPDQLSGGMQQRVAVAQALMTGPRVLLMDEAFSALDPGTRRSMQQLIRQLWQATGTTVLFVTHHTEEALRIGSRVVVLAKDAPDRASRIAMDRRVPETLTDEEVPALIRQIESVSEGKSDWIEAPTRAHAVIAGTAPVQEGA